MNIITPDKARERLRFAVVAGVVTPEQVNEEVAKHSTDGVLNIKDNPQVLVIILKNLLGEDYVVGTETAI